MKNLILFLLQGIPEMTGFIALSLAFAQIQIKWQRVILLGTLISIVVYILRLLPIAFGIHTLVFPLLTVIIITRFTATPPSKALLVSFLSLAVLVLLELIINEPVIFFTKMEPAALMSNTKLWVLLGVFQAFLLNIIAIVVSRFRKPKKDVWTI